ncbi:putative sensor domain DACNV-containing protein [Bremerella cremea]|uniref:putative sensor domain DACNV-containing protein n=1 Tax=Bremerella cremea TaxID=1031537 RepID=UPI0031EDDD87
MTDVTNIDEFAKLVAERFRESQQSLPERFNLELQDDSVVALVEAMFYASMNTDESRWPGVTLMCYRSGEEPDFSLSFKESIEPTAQHISKLAHAVSSDSHLCCICRNGKMSIDGIHMNIMDERRELGYASFRLGNPLQLTISGPGHLSVSNASVAMVYKAGEASEENLFKDCTIVNLLANHVESKLSPLTRGVIESLQDVFNDFAASIHRNGHGGVILISRGFDKSQFSSMRATDCDILHKSLVNYWDLVADLTSDEGAMQQMQLGEETKYGLRISSLVSILEKCVSMVGQLAEMDGAILVDFDLKVVAFNSIIAKLEVPEGIRFFDGLGVQHEYSNVIENRGSRHQSALTWVMSVPDSFAFVISQDGSVSAFHNAGEGNVQYEYGLKLLKC